MRRFFASLILAMPLIIQCMEEAKVTSYGSVNATSTSNSLTATNYTSFDRLAANTPVMSRAHSMNSVVLDPRDEDETTSLTNSHPPSQLIAIDQSTHRCACSPCKKPFCFAGACAALFCITNASSFVLGYLAAIHLDMPSAGHQDQSNSKSLYIMLTEFPAPQLTISK